MAPSIEERPRHRYVIRFAGGDTAEVLAERVCEPSKDDPYLTFKRDDVVVVGKYKAGDVEGWHIEGTG